MTGRFRGLTGEFIAWGLTIGIPLIAVFLLLARPAWDLLFQAPAAHFYIVSTVCLLSLVFSVIVLIAGVRLADQRMELMALGFFALAGIFAVHGLATPGFIVASNNPAVGVSARLSFLASAVFFAASALDFQRGLGLRILHLRRVARVLVPVLVVAFIIVGTFAPGWLAFVPATSAPLSWLVTGATILLLAYAAARFIGDYTLARLPMQAAFVFGFLLIADSAAIVSVSVVWRASWWSYHVLMLAGFLLLVAGLILEYGRGGSIQEILGGTFVHSQKASLERGYTEGMRALISAIEVKHPYTRGHADRVTEIAMLIAQEMKLPPDRLRILALGGIMHDIGKIGVPDAILNKPGRLTDEEFDTIKRHPLLGDDMVSRIGSLRAAHWVVRHHHEWINGKGYPDGLTYEQLTLEARIIAVADTFEALTSRRSYREAFDRQAAYDILRQEAGSHLDPDIVGVWLSIADRWTRTPRRADPVAPPSGEAAPSA